MAKKETLWSNYKKALDSITTAKKNASIAFGNLFTVGGRVHYQQQTGGKIHTGHILNVNSLNLRLNVANIKTGKTYWIESFWITGTT